MFTRIIMSLEDWSAHYPCGVIAFDENENVYSEYCDTVEEYEEFFDEHSDMIDSETELIASVRVEDIECCMDLITAVKELLDERRNNNA